MASTKHDAVPSTSKRKASEIECATTCETIRENLANIIALKKDGKSLNPDTLYAHVTNISLAFSDLKGSNRDAQMENENKKNEV